MKSIGILTSIFLVYLYSQNSMAVSLEIPAITGQVSTVGDIDPTDIQIEITWSCQKWAYFAPSGRKSCGEGHSGKVTISADSQGKFITPEIKDRHLSISEAWYSSSLKIFHNNSEFFDGSPVTAYTESWGANPTSSAVIREEIEQTLQKISVVKINGVTKKLAITGIYQGKPIPFGNLKDVFPKRNGDGYVSVNLNVSDQCSSLHSYDSQAETIVIKDTFCVFVDADSAEAVDMKLFISPSFRKKDDDRDYYPESALQWQNTIVVDPRDITEIPDTLLEGLGEELAFDIIN